MLLYFNHYHNKSVFESFTFIYIKHVGEFQIPWLVSLPHTYCRSRAEVLSPGPRESPSWMFKMFLCFYTPDV